VFHRLTISQAKKDCARFGIVLVCVAPTRDTDWIFFEQDLAESFESGFVRAAWRVTGCTEIFRGVTGLFWLERIHSTAPTTRS
jgi:hypothetical protein